MLWAILTIIATMIWATTNIIDKTVLSKWVKNPLVILSVFGVLSFIVSILIYLLRGFSQFSITSISLGILSGIIVMISGFFYLHALKIEEVSRVVPLVYFYPLFVSILAAIFLNEVFTFLKYFGVILLVIGAVLLSSKNLKISLSKAFWMMIAYSIAMATAISMIKYLLNITDYWTVFAYEGIGLFLFIIPIVFLMIPDIKKMIKKYGKKVIIVISTNESLKILAGLVSTIAFSVGYVTFVSALSSVQPFFVLSFVVLLSMFYPEILKEKITKSILIQKIFAITLMFIGAILIL